jgi:hypothetical protein
MTVITLGFTGMDAAFKEQMVAIMTLCVAEIVELSGCRVELQVGNDRYRSLALVGRTSDLS